MGIPTNPNPRSSGYDGTIKPPQIEWVANNEKTVKRLALPNSSWLESMTYDPSTQRLTVTTKEGATWQHAQVSAGQFTELQLANSKGSYYTRTIKGQTPTTVVKQIPKIKEFPNSKELNREKAKTSFQNPLYDRYTNRYKGGKRYS